MSMLRLKDGRVFEMRETADEMFELIGGSSGLCYLRCRQPGRAHARYRGLTIHTDQIASIEDEGLGWTTTGPTP